MGIQDVFFILPLRRTRISAQLRTFNFNAADLNRELDQMPLKVAKLAGYIYQNLEIDANGVARVVSKVF